MAVDIAIWNLFHHISSNFVPAPVVISSTGGTAEISGEILGQYEYDENTECYVQTSTEQKNEAFIGRFLCSTYYQNSKWWVVTLTPNEEFETSHAYIMSMELHTGWIYYDGDTWKPDPSLTVTSGSLPPLPSQFTVTASGVLDEIGQSYLGVFNKTERWFSGKPVYVNTQGRLLYQNRPGWAIGDELRYYSIIGSRSYPNPICERSWTYVTDNGIEKPASVKIVSGKEGELVFDILVKIAKILHSKSFRN